MVSVGIPPVWKTDAHHKISLRHLTRGQFQPVIPDLLAPSTKTVTPRSEHLPPMMRMSSRSSIPPGKSQASTRIIPSIGSRTEPVDCRNQTAEECCCAVFRLMEGCYRGCSCSESGEDLHAGVFSRHDAIRSRLSLSFQIYLYY